ncbi:hypothetical protein DPX16_17889 [Anabarilius grahami]|uniref:Uncharacterized protein n=1 Tax=Anabarilius grahami TaxID=495550 RepID=A0A3N0YHK6_ANAGA|nr:hypothetical protein DPX16_17889 [Anabarilius grahami]
MSGVQDQTGQEFAVSQPTNFFSDADLAFAGVLSENSEAHGSIQSWSYGVSHSILRQLVKQDSGLKLAVSPPNTSSTPARDPIETG